MHVANIPCLLNCIAVHSSYHIIKIFFLQLTEFIHSVLYKHDYIYYFFKSYDGEKKDKKLREIKGLHHFMYSNTYFFSIIEKLI